MSIPGCDGTGRHRTGHKPVSTAGIQHAGTGQCELGREEKGTLYYTTVGHCSKYVAPHHRKSAGIPLTLDTPCAGHPIPLIPLKHANS